MVIDSLSSKTINSHTLFNLTSSILTVSKSKEQVNSTDVSLPKNRNLNE